MSNEQAKTVVVSSAGKTIDSHVDERFGRAAYFLVVDPADMSFEVIDNAGTAAGGGGIYAAKLVIDAGAQVVLTGNCGPNAEQTLRAAGVKLFTGVGGTVAEALEQYRAGTLSEASGPSVPSHFGIGT